MLSHVCFLCFMLLIMIIKNTFYLVGLLQFLNTEVSGLTSFAGRKNIFWGDKIDFMKSADE